MWLSAQIETHGIINMRNLLLKISGLKKFENETIQQDREVWEQFILVVWTCDIWLEKDRISFSLRSALASAWSRRETNTRKKGKSILFNSQEKWFCTNKAVLSFWNTLENQVQCSTTFNIWFKWTDILCWK